MKKHLAIILNILILTGCSNNVNDKNNETKNTITSDAQIETMKLKNENEVLPDNMEKIDLSLSENSKYMENLDEFTYNEEFELPDGRKIVEDKSIYLEEANGEKTVLINIPEELTEQYAVFCDMIDENRFYYYIIWHESTAGTGIYNLETGEDFRIDKTNDQNYHYVPYKKIENYLFLKKCKIAYCGGLAKLDLNSYEITDIKCSFMNNDKNYNGMDFSHDGKKAVFCKTNKISKNLNDANDYKITIYSIEDDKVLESLIFSSENYYLGFVPKYKSENKIYLYAYYSDDHPKNFDEAANSDNEPKWCLYIINTK